MKPEDISDEAKAAFEESADFTIYNMLQDIVAYTDDDGALDFNALLKKIIPMTIARFLLHCPDKDLLAMAADVRAFTAANLPAALQPKEAGGE